MSLKTTLTAVGCAAALSVSFAAEKAIELPGLDGKPVDALSVDGKKAVVLFFISPYCPTSNTFGPVMNEIAAEFSEDFVFRFIHSDISVREADIIQHASMMAIEHPVLADKEQALAKRVGAKITPEAVVVDAEGKTLYQGRINDLYLGATKRQREATVHDLRDALTEIREGKPVTNAKVEAVGCEIGGL